MKSSLGQLICRRIWWPPRSDVARWRVVGSAWIALGYLVAVTGVGIWAGIYTLRRKG